MKRHFLDTNAVSDFMNRRRGVYERTRAAGRQGKIGTCAPVIGELLHGIESCVPRDENMRMFQRSMHGIVCRPLDRSDAAEYGKLAATQKRIGRKCSGSTSRSR